MRLNLKSKRTWKKILSVVLGVGLAFGSVIGITNLVQKIEEDNLKTIRPTYHQGALDDTTGKYLESKEKIYSDIFECQGLTITPKFESDVSYRVFYYDTNENFLTRTETLADFYQSNYPLARYARIEITPDKDTKISWYEIFKYSRKLKVEVNKEQEYELIDHFVAGEHTLNYVMQRNEDTIEKISRDGVGFVKIDVSSMSKIKIIFKGEGQAIQNYFVDSNGNQVGNNVNLFVTDTEVIVDVPENANYFFANYSVGKEYTIHQIL